MCYNQFRADIYKRGKLTSISANEDGQYIDIVKELTGDLRVSVCARDKGGTLRPIIVAQTTIKNGDWDALYVHTKSLPTSITDLLLPENLNKQNRSDDHDN